MIWFDLLIGLGLAVWTYGVFRLGRYFGKNFK